MLKIIQLGGYLDKQIIETNQLIGNSLVYFDNENYYSELNPLGWLPGIIKYDTVSKKIDYYRFPTNVRIVSHQGEQDTLYYALMNWERGTVLVHFKKLNCTDFSDFEITSIQLEYENEIEKSNSKLNSIGITGINERYAIVSIPQINHKYGLPIYSQIMLLDSNEKKHYVFKETLGNNDSMLRLEKIVVSEDGKFLLLKTGNIGWFEKKDFWDIGRKDYFDQLENLVLIDVESFIKYIKNGTQIPDSFIIDKCSFESAFTNICVINGTLKYQRVSFTDNTTEFISYDINSKQTKKINIYGIYERIYNINESIFAVTTDENSKNIIDVKNSKCIYSAITPAEQIIYFDNENVITAIPQEGLKHEIINHNIIDNKVDKLGFGWFTFNDRQKILTIFN